MNPGAASSNVAATVPMIASPSGPGVNASPPPTSDPRPSTVASLAPLTAATPPAPIPNVAGPV